MGTAVVLGVVEDGSDDQRLDELARQLRSELLQLEEVESVESVTAGEAPEGTRAGLVTVAGALVASLSPTALLSLARTVLDWVRRSGAEKSVRLEIDGDVIDLKGVSDDVQERLLEEWLRRHAAA